MQTSSKDIFLANTSISENAEAVSINICVFFHKIGDALLRAPPIFAILFSSPIIPCTG